MLFMTQNFIKSKGVSPLTSPTGGYGFFVKNSDPNHKLNRFRFSAAVFFFHRSHTNFRNSNTMLSHDLD